MEKVPLILSCKLVHSSRWETKKLAQQRGAQDHMYKNQNSPDQSDQDEATSNLGVGPPQIRTYICPCK